MLDFGNVTSIRGMILELAGENLTMTRLILACNYIHLMRLSKGLLHCVTREGNRPKQILKKMEV